MDGPKVMIGSLGDLRHEERWRKALGLGAERLRDLGREVLEVPRAVRGDGLDDLGAVPRPATKAPSGTPIAPPAPSVAPISAMAEPSRPGRLSSVSVTGWGPCLCSFREAASGPYP